jgi:hypothetical protein
MATVAVIIKDIDQQYEGLRSSLGLLLEASGVQMYVLDHEIQALANADDENNEAYEANIEFFDDFEGEKFSNNPANIEKWGFTAVTDDELIANLKNMDIIIPF